MERLPAGTLLCEGRYGIISTDERRIKVRRLKTGSEVVVTRRMIERTVSRLHAGPVAKRSISYTVAIEETVLAAIRVVLGSDFAQTTTQSEVDRHGIETLYEHGGLEELDHDYYKAESANQ